MPFIKRLKGWIKMKDEGMKGLLSAGPEQLADYAASLQRMIVVHTVTSKHSQLIKSTLAGDEKSAAAMFHPDFIAVDVEGNKSTAAEELENLRSGRLKIESNEIEKYEVHPFGPHLAIATGVARTKGTFDGKDISGTYRFHQLWAVNSTSQFGAVSSDMSMVASFNGSFEA